ncbi:MAG: TraR/DksA family transcriptional regulator [Candidatus Andersenbacteria bacterium]
MHSPEFIQEMKMALQEEEQDVRAKLERLARKEEGDYQADFPDYGRKDEENASEVADYQASYATTEALEARLEEVGAALKRIEAGTYGATGDGEEIPEDRLRANPAATTLVVK